MGKYDDCDIGRRMELNVAQMKSDIENIKENNQNQSKSLLDISESLKRLDDKLDIKIDSLKDIYASREVVEDIKIEFNWIKVITITSLISIIGFLITQLIQQFK